MHNLKKKKVKDSELNNFENEINKKFSSEIYKYSEYSGKKAVLILIIWIIEGIYTYLCYKFNTLDSTSASIFLFIYAVFLFLIIDNMRYYHKKKPITEIIDRIADIKYILITNTFVLSLTTFLSSMNDVPSIDFMEIIKIFILMYSILITQYIFTLSILFNFNKSGQFLYQLYRIQMNVEKPFKILNLINSLNSLLNEIGLRILNQDELKNKIIQIFFKYRNKSDIFNSENQNSTVITDTFLQKLHIDFIKYIMKLKKLKDITPENWFNFYTEWISKQGNEITKNNKNDNGKEFYQLIFLRAPFYFFLNIYNQTNSEIEHMTILDYFVNSLKFNVKISSNLTFIEKISKYQHLISLISLLLTILYFLFNFPL